ncbi:MAG: DUF4145 domain-containing protein [Deltaproteobacteria bacterium]|nr:DUF4145 domain-containing protein [Deltaproteobacteria bacterium]
MVPDGVPARIANYYSDAVKTHGMKIYHASGKLCRQVLEFALADRFPKFKGSLYERIKELSGKGMLLTEMASWANEIRELGNDAAHADPFTREEADDIMLLTEYMLVYLYTLPGIIARRALKGSAPAGGGSEEP